MGVDKFSHSLERWIVDVERYDFARLCTKPSAATWSLGQLSIHLIKATTFYLEQSEICLSTDDNALKEMSGEAKVMFNNDSFPDELIEGPPSNAATPQPESKEDLMRDLRALKDKINRVTTLISAGGFGGKTKHPGLQYFNAEQWFRFADMHFRHHLRQKKRIEEFLKVD